MDGLPEGTLPDRLACKWSRVKLILPQGFNNASKQEEVEFAYW